MNHQVKLTGNLKTYLRWPMTLSLLWAVATIQIYMVNHKAGYCVAGYTLAYFVFAMMLRMTGRKKLQQDLIQFAQSYGRLQMKMMKEMAVPFGAYVRETAMESPAMLAGVQKGDVIVEINGEAVTKFSDYTAILLRSMPGDTLKVKFMRSAQGEYREMETEITVNAAKK